MVYLFLIGLFLIIFGRKLRYKYLYSDSNATTLYQSFLRIKRMDQDSACYVIGGLSLEFAGFIVFLSILANYF
jgi:hypothetical protein